MPNVQTYRSDIDGLRALAVVSVLLFHARLGAPGGFVGVDVFFVISGYLISGLIFKEVASSNQSSFSLVHFWERRICRILPPVTAVMSVTFLAAWLIVLPDDLSSLGRSVIAQAALISNIYFFSQPNGYFDPSQDAEPLLHTWSLAVEEQFYLLYPLLLLVLVKRGRRAVGWTLAGLAAASLALSVLGTENHPRAAFYLLPTRAWELLLGALLALHSGAFAVPGKLRELAGGIGLTLIAVAILTFGKETPFPGYAAILPCLGAALIIFSSEAGLSRVGSLLSFRPIVFVGLISYSLYLWHWPLLVLFKYVAGEQRWWLRAVVLLASFVLACISWVLVERPSRGYWKSHPRWQVFALGGGLVAALSVVGMTVDLLDGIPSRFSPTALRYAGSRDNADFRNSVDLEQALAGQFPSIGATNYLADSPLLLWGDSHAMAVAPALDELGKRFNRRVIHAMWTGTPPIARGGSNSVGNVDELGVAVIEYVRQNSVRQVVIVAHWKFYARSPSFGSDLVVTVRRIIETGAKVYLLQDVPDQGLDVPRVAALTENYGGEVDRIGIAPDAHRAANDVLFDTFEQLNGMGVVLLDPALLFRNQYGLYGVRRDGKILYADATHLSVDGALLLAPVLEPAFLSN